MNEDYLNSSEFKNDRLYWVNQLTDIENYIKHYKIDSNDFESQKISIPVQK